MAALGEQGRQWFRTYRAFTTHMFGRELLIQGGVDIHSVAADRGTALHAACEKRVMGNSSTRRPRSGYIQGSDIELHQFCKESVPSAAYRPPAPVIFQRRPIYGSVRKHVIQEDLKANPWLPKMEACSPAIFILPSFPVLRFRCESKSL